MAFGLALRAAGQGNKVLIYQFLKPPSVDVGERFALQLGAVRIRVEALEEEWDMAASFDDEQTVARTKAAIRDVGRVLGMPFGEVDRIHGFHIVARENRVRRSSTALSNVLKGTAGLPTQIKAYFELTEDFEPEAVISDFESWAYLFGLNHMLPVISIDNMQVLNRCRHDFDVTDFESGAFKLAKYAVTAKLQRCRSARAWAEADPFSPIKRRTWPGWMGVRSTPLLSNLHPWTIRRVLTSGSYVMHTVIRSSIS